MVYNELCHKEIDWSKAMKQILIILVAVMLGSTAISSYAEEYHTVRVGDKRVHVFEKTKGNPTVTEESNSEGGKELEIRRMFGDKEPNSDVSDEGKKNLPVRIRAE